MATVNTIGTSSRDYSTIQAWEDAVPATPTGGYEGHCYNDSEFTAGVAIAGHTTSSTNYILLTAASGQSFQDHANVRSNALFYNQANGVALVANPFAVPVVNVDNNFVTISRFQIKRATTSYTNNVVSYQSGHSSSWLRDCIVEKSHNTGITIANMRASNAANCLVVDSGGGTNSGMVFTGGSAICLNCTVVRSTALGAAAGTGVNAAYGGAVCTNTASFGWTTAFGTHSGSSDFNAADDATAPGANSLDSQTYADQFQSTTNDFRLKTGATLIDAGSTDATNAPNDISATARGLTTDGDIGCWEFVAAGGAAAASTLMLLGVGP